VQTAILCLCTVTQLLVITPKQDGEVCTTLIDAVGQLRFIQLYSVNNSDSREKKNVFIRGSQKARPYIVYCMLFTMWTRENFTDLHHIIPESTRVAIFEWDSLFVDSLRSPLKNSMYTA